MAGRIPNVSTRIVPKSITLPETGSCFDTTVVVPKVCYLSVGPFAVKLMLLPI